MFEDYENFSEDQIKILQKYVSNATSHVFALRNLPEVIKGAVFSRYSRSTLGLRSLILKEFILEAESGFKAIVDEVKEEGTDQGLAIKKAQDFYDRILDGYGDDSIGELGSAHLAIENISLIAAKVMETPRIGGSPLEKSTRYVSFSQKHRGEYEFYQEPILMTSAYKECYLKTCRHLFDTYTKLIPILTEFMKRALSQNPTVPESAYQAALRSKVLDCLRGLLPASTLTNMGLCGNGRFFEALIQRLHSHNLAEMRCIGSKAYLELGKVIPSFIRRADPENKYQKSFSIFYEKMHGDLAVASKEASLLSLLSKENPKKVKGISKASVRLVQHDPDSPYRVAAALLFPSSDMSLADLQRHCRSLPNEKLREILELAGHSRENRRHKSPRGLEQAVFTFEIVADFGIYRDLQRHRMLTQDRQILTCNLGYYIPEEILDSPVQVDYIEALESAKETYDLIAQEFPEEAQYVVPIAYHVRWYFEVNLRALQWICELRSSPAGHPAYRLIAQDMAKQLIQAYPVFEPFFKFVDFSGYDLGRLDAEIRTSKKNSSSFNPIT